MSKGVCLGNKPHEKCNLKKDLWRDQSKQSSSIFFFLKNTLTEKNKDFVVVVAEAEGRKRELSRSNETKNGGC